MNKPVIADRAPRAVKMKAGEERHWCACGRSNKQPFCDGSHAGTGFSPVAFKAKEDGDLYLCMCKQTGNPPYCDGTHSKLAADHLSDAEGEWHRLDGVSDMQDGEVRPAEVNGIKLAITRYEGQFGALDYHCPHQGGPLAEGEIKCKGKNDCYLTCPWHGYEFHPITGKGPAGFEDFVPAYKVEERKDGIYVQLPADMKAEKVSPPQAKATPEEPTVQRIHELAKHGLEKVGHHGEMVAMGVPRPTLPQWDDIQLLAAQFASKPLMEDVAVGTELVIGPKARKPLTLKIPLFVSDMSFGALSQNAKVALATGAELAGTGICSGEGGMLPEEQQANSRYFYEYASAGFGYSEAHLPKVQAFHFKGGQGAKTGTGGHLPGSKVTEKIAEVRGLKPGGDAVSPPTFADLNSPKDFSRFSDRVREVSGGIPIGMKLSANHIEDDIDFALASGVDYIILDGRGGGTGAAPRIFRDHISVPTIPALARARRHLDAKGADDVTLIITGGLRLPEDFIKALALGADGVALSNAALQSIGCVAARVCNTNQCPAGIATQDSELSKRLDIDEAAAKLARFFGASTHLMQVMARACGHDHISGFNQRDITTWKKEMAELTGIRFGGVGSGGEA